MILIIGATGSIGREAAAKLVAAGHKVRALSRDPQRAQSMPELKDVEIVTGDPNKPETLDAVFAGADKVLLIPPSSADWNIGEKNLIDAARRAGVKHVVKVSVVEADPAAPSKSLSFHAQGEALLRESGLDYTILRPNSFMQNFTIYYAPTIRSAGAVYQCTGDVKLAMIDTRDIADVAVLALTTDGHIGKSYDLTGPEALSYSDAVRHIGAVTEREVRYIDMPADVYTQAMISAGVPDWIAIDMGNIYGRGSFREGLGARVTSTVSELLGRPARSFADFAREHAALFRP